MYTDSSGNNYRTCPQCRNGSLFVHVEQFGMDYRQVQPGKCEVCGWTETRSSSDRLMRLPMTEYEVRYINNRTEFEPSLTA